MKRDYPLFLIDRSKHSAYPFDFVFCADKTCGFVAKVVAFFKAEPFNEFVKQREQIEAHEYTSILFRFPRGGGMAVVVEEFLFEFDENNKEHRARIKTLLKKALKKYLHAEVERTAHTDMGIDDQIKQQEATIDRAKSNYDFMVQNASKDEVDYNIALAEATLETLKKFRDNQKYFTIDLN